ncbi:Alpha/Beta hydrolase protein [Halteromyces radiatus]|uniref:Alpha/Beta hydrolase protein n=1 Tax=Halteromyces radiatus TaxID=101107 RepID=UPI002220E5C8|nr:Alpha/Beta hydrolase protein [Halteromyces radiatus]KAI8096676.1 Alpha/Beta hydrolase protein [Halteromyces radiatus]
MLVPFIGVFTLLVSLTMARTFTPEDLVSLARPGGVSPDPTGHYAVYAESNYIIDQDKTQKNIYLLDLESSTVTPLTQPPLGDTQSEPLFLDADHVAYLWKTNNSLPQLYVVNIQQQQPYVISDFPVPIENIKFNRHRQLLTFSALVYNDKDTLQQTKEKDDQIKDTKQDTALVYDELMVRHWDTFLSEKQNNIFAVSLEFVNGQYQLKGEPRNLLKNSGLQSPLFPLGGASDYVVSDDGTELAFVSKITSRDNAWQTSQHIYTLSLVDSNESTPVALNDDIPAASSTPTYAPKSGRLAYLQMKTPQYEADRNQITIYDRQTKTRVEIAKDWDRSPSELIFSPDESTLYVVAEEYGRVKLFAIDLATEKVTTLTNDHAVSGVSLLENSNSLLFSVSSMNHPAIAHTLDLANGDLRRLATSDKLKTALEQFSLVEPEEFNFIGALGDSVHGWLIKPNGLDPNKKYPVALEIHGGPQSLWADSWSTRWNYQVIASAGYVVVAINPHGSTGYGQDFCDAIQKNWFTYPYEDIMTGLDYVLENYSYLDADRLIGMGASYGATMVNYINGHTDRFKALISHDGIFSAVNAYYTTDELYFPEREFGGPAYDPVARVTYERFSPSNFVHRWKTPTLVIHGKEKD